MIICVWAGIEIESEREREGILLTQIFQCILLFCLVYRWLPCHRFMIMLPCESSAGCAFAHGHRQGDLFYESASYFIYHIKLKIYFFKILLNMWPCSLVLKYMDDNYLLFIKSF